MATLSQPPVPMPRSRVWLLAVRPWSLTISVVPILLATSLAWTYGNISILLAILMLLTSILTHIACNLTNDYFDNESGVDGVQVDGHGGMLQDGHLSSRELLIGMVIAFAMALLFGLPIIVRLGWIGLLFALVGAGVAFLYTGGPWPLAYNRMGEIGVFIAMGIVMVGGAFYVLTDMWTWPAILLAAAVGSYAAAVLHANNMRDRAVDAMHRKHTFANTFGWKWGVREYITLAVAPLVLVIMLVIESPKYWALLAAVIVVPNTVRAIRHLQSTEEGELTSALVRQTTRLHLHFGAIITFALLLTRLVQQ